MPVLRALTLAVDASDCVASVASLAASLASLERLPDHLVDRIDRLLVGDNNGGRLFRAEAVAAATPEAGELHPVRILPGDDYLELVAALADDVGVHVSWLSHGWPLLASCESKSKLAAEAYGARQHPGASA